MLRDKAKIPNGDGSIFSRENRTVPISFGLDLKGGLVVILENPSGAVAQLGEHLTGSQKVVGSSPISSTISFWNL